MTSQRPEILILVPTALEAEALFGSTPTGRRLQEIPQVGHGVCIGLTGFGLASSGVMASGHLRFYNPRLCLLVGLAGTLDVDRAPLESVVAADRVYYDGIGVGEGETALSAESLGFWPAPGIAGHHLSLRAPASPVWRTSDLLSVATGSADLTMSRRRHQQFPTCVAEDMESWSVALACRVFHVPLLILRGISNTAGQRDKAHWRFQSAFSALRTAVLSAIDGFRAGNLF